MSQHSEICKRKVLKLFFWQTRPLDWCTLTSVTKFRVWLENTHTVVLFFKKYLTKGSNKVNAQAVKHAEFNYYNTTMVPRYHAGFLSHLTTGLDEWQLITNNMMQIIIITNPYYHVGVKVLLFHLNWRIAKLSP